MDKKLNYTLYSYLSKNLKIGTSFLGGRIFQVVYVCIIDQVVLKEIIA
jgi:hypothetical protein